MKTRFSFLILSLFASAIFVESAYSHYLWVSVARNKDKKEITNVYFEEGPRVGDGFYLDPFFKRGKIWMQSPGNKPVELKITEINQKEKKKRWATSELTVSAPRSVSSYFKFGVYQYGKTFVLLHYNAKNLDLSSHEDLHDLGRSENLNLDIVPHDEQEKVRLTVLWNGKPAVNRTMKIRGPKKFQTNLKTDKNGAVLFTPKNKGRYTFLTNVEEDVEGKFEGKEYQLIRHHSSLVMTLPLEK